MADFRTHMIGGVVAGCAAAAAGMGMGLIRWELAPLLALTGFVGSMGPDLDSDSGRPVQLVFRVAAVVLPLALVYRVPILSEDQLTAAVSFALLALLVRYPMAWIFQRFTVHRGIFHSIPAVVICGCLTALFAARNEARPALQMAMGAAAALGYLTHLLLDELWAVDFNGKKLKFKVKRSFGTAMQLWGLNWWTSVTAYALAIGLSLLVWQDLQGQRPERLFQRHVLRQMPGVIERLPSGPGAR